MLYYTLGQILSSALSALLFGLFFGIFHSLLSAAFIMLSSILTIPKNAIRLTSHKSLSRSRDLSEKNAPNISERGSVAVLFMKDFIYTLSFAIFFILLLYERTDGEPRLYMLVFAIGAAYISERTLGRALLLLFKRMLVWLVTALSFLLGVLLFPVRRTFDFFYKFLEKITKDRI